MSKTEPDFKMRLSGGQYLALPEATRGALIIGMVEMLELTSTRLGPAERPQIDSILRYARPLSERDLRIILDQYLSDTKAALQYAIASDLIVALSEKCGLKRI